MDDRIRLTVGVGASTGGLEAFRQLLDALPEDTGMALILIQHLDPDHESLLAELLNSHTRLPVVEAVDAMVLEPDTVYVIPPNKSLAVKDGRITLTEPVLKHGVRLPLDHLFESLAQDLGPRSAGVVLSGSGRDGSNGLRSLRAAGGLVIAQDPETCEDASMPQTALDTGAVDMVCEIGEIPAALKRFADLPTDTRVAMGPPSSDDDSGDTTESRSSDVISDDQLMSLVKLVESLEDVDLGVYKTSILRRRIMRRILLADLPSFAEFSDILRRDEKQRRILVQDLLISVTEFFRDPKAYRQVATWLDERLLARPDTSHFRGWVAGCATGEEAYSLVIEVMEAARRAERAIDIQIFATDVDEPALSIARSGVYSSSIADRIPTDILNRYFRPLPGRGFAIAPKVRDSISFAVHDLTRDPPFSRMDIVTCRNVLIYLQSKVQDRVIQSLEFALRPGGMLFLGTSEALGEHKVRFRARSRAWRLFEKPADDGTSASDSSPSVGRSHPPAHQRKPAQPGNERLRVDRSASSDRMRQAALDAAMPPTVVVDGNNDVRFAHGQLSPFLHFPEGEPRLELSAVVNPALADTVRSAVLACRRSGTSVIRDTRLEDTELTVAAQPAADCGDEAVVVSFRVTDSGHSRQAPLPDDKANMLVAQLNNELHLAREDLRITVEELEASNEELRAAHEEATSMNEELQSANEELEATGEELRSVNEELTALNTQLREKIAQVQRANEDLSNFFSSSRIPMLFLDEDLRITRFTPAAARLLKLDHSAAGRYIGDFAREILQNGLVEAAREVQKSEVPTSHELRLKDGTYLDRRVFPYVTQRGDHGGLVISIFDVTEQRRASESVVLSEERLKMASEAGSIGITDIDLATGEMKWNDVAVNLLGLASDGDVSIDDYWANVHPDDIQSLKQAVERAIEAGEGASFTHEHRVRHGDTGEYRWIAETGQVLVDEHDMPARRVGTLQDITDRKDSERQQRLHSAIVQDSSDAIFSWRMDGSIASWNPSAGRIFGFVDALKDGLMLQDLIPADQSDEFDQITSSIAAGQVVRDLETLRRRQDNTAVRVSLTISPLHDESGTIVGASTIARDVTEANRMRQLLARQEESLRLAADCAEMGTFDLDFETGNHEWSERLQSIFGVMGRDTSAQNPFAPEFVHPEDAPGVIESLASSRRRDGDQRFNKDFRIQRPDGEIRWVSIRAVMHFSDQSHRAVRMVGAVVDITEKKHADLQIKESEARLRRLFDQAPAAIAIHEGPAHRYVYANPQYVALTGERELIGLALADALPELADDATRKRFDHVYESGESLLTEGFKSLVARPEAGERSDRFFNYILQPWFDGDGAVAGIMSFAYEVTNEVNLRRAAEENEERFRVLADNISQLAWMADAEGFIFWYNQRWFDYTGTDLKAMEGWGWKKVHHPDHVDLMLPKWKNSLQTGEVWEDTFPLRGADGEYRWFLSRANPTRDEDGNITRWLGTNTDITDRLRIEEELRDSDRRKDEFLAMLGHELRNPLAAISSASELLNLMADNNRTVSRVATILERQTMHMASLVDGLLEVSRITRGKIELTRETIDLGLLVKRVLEDRSGRSADRGLKIKSAIPAEPMWVRADPVRITQVLDNLIGNAVKFTDPPGKVEISVRADPGEKLAIITVADTGVGIEPDLVDRLFEPFQQGRQELARSAGGLGLGLALVKGVIELHDGAVFAASAGPGKGATLTVQLPLTGPPLEGETFVEEDKVSGRSLNVLIVEDNRDAAEMLSELLEMEGHTTTSSFSGESALEMIGTQDFDLVLCDLGLPGMDGYQVAEKLRQMPAGRQLRLVALTGYGQPDDRQRSAAAGFDHHLTKPLELAALREFLRHLQ